MSGLFYKGLMIALLKTILYCLLVIPLKCCDNVAINYTFNMNRMFYLSAYPPSFNAVPLVKMLKNREVYS